MRPATLFLPVGLLLAGCSRPGTPAPAATRLTLQPIDLHETVALAYIDIRTTVTPDGVFRRETRHNGPFDPHRGTVQQPYSVEVCRGVLTPAQMTELATLFDGWPALASHPYGGVADGPHIEFRYGPATVISGGDLPPAAAAARSRLNEWAAARPSVVR